MGASTFENIGFGSDVKDAFYNAKEEARSRNGHQEGYSGDVQTKSEFVLLDVGRKNQRTVINEYIDSTSSDDPAGAIVLKGEAAKLAKERLGFKNKRGKVVLFVGWGRS
jgi:hypothetical protein